MSVHPNPHAPRADAPTEDNEDLLFSGSPVILLNHSGRSNNTGWMQFNTDPCGSLQGVENGRSMIRQGAFDDDMDELDEDDGDDPSEMGRELIGRWLSSHAEIAVMNDGVDKACDLRDQFDDQELPGAFEASRTNHEPAGFTPPFQRSGIA